MSVVSVIGTQAVLKALKKVAGSSPTEGGYAGALAASIYQEGVAIMGVSVQQVPVDTGRLRSTHYVAPPRARIGQAVVELGYGTNYAVHVHEDTSKRHGPAYVDRKGRARGAGQKARFLRDPLNAARRGYARRVAQRAAANFRRGITSAVLSDMPQRPRSVRGGK